MFHFLPLDQKYISGKPWDYTSKIIRTQRLVGPVLPNLFEEKQENGG
jgi:hypothetical protein